MATQDTHADTLTHALQGLRILVVEDEALIAMMIEDVLGGFGCEIVGPVARLASAQQAARTREFDCAVLDVNLGGQSVHPVAEILAQRDIPFIFVTGYGTAGPDGRFDDRPVLQKPFKPTELRAALAELAADRPRRSP